MNNNRYEGTATAQYHGENMPDWQENRAIVDIETGEIVLRVANKRTSSYGSLDPIPAMRYFNPKRGYKFRHGGKLIVKMSVDCAMPEEFSYSDIGKLYFLARSVNYLTGYLSTQNRQNRIRPLKISDMAKLLGVTVSSISKLIAKLKKHNIIRRTKRGEWSLNPMYFAPNYINKEIFDLWRDILHNVIPMPIQAVFDGYADPIDGYVHTERPCEYSEMEQLQELEGSIEDGE